LRKEKEIVAFAVLTCLLLTSIQTVLADGTVTCPSSSPYCAIFGPFIAPGNEPTANSPFDATFLHMIGASVSLSSGIYTFEVTVLSTPPDWMTSAWQPTFAAPHAKTKLSEVGANWVVIDASRDSLALLHFAWRDGTLELRVFVCPPSKSSGCFASIGVGAGIGYKIYTNYELTSLTGSFNQGTKTLTVTISQSDLNSVFPSPATAPTFWRAFTAACLTTDITTSGESCTGYVTTPRLSLPTIAS
jgi:hypothetical protein